VGTLRLWGRTTSVNVRKILWLAEELALDIPRIDAGREHGVVDGAAFRAMNPNGRVPVLETESGPLWESNSILRYLAATHGAALHGETAWERAQVDRWLDWQLSTLTPVESQLFGATIRVAPQERSQAEIDGRAVAMLPALSILDSWLEKRGNLALGRFTIADVAVGALVHRWFANPFVKDRPALPGLRKWHSALRERRAFALHVDVELV
jgi:glutathione S-transferase